MGIVALSGGDIALIVLAAFWGVLVLFLGAVLLNTFRMIESTKTLIDGLNRETIPLLGEVRVTVTSVNRKLDAMDVIVDSAGKMSKSAERVTSVVEQTVQSPLIKAVAFSAGASAAMRRFKGKKT